MKTALRLKHAHREPIWILWFYNKQEERTGRLFSRHEATQARIRENRMMEGKGEIAVIWGGMDCDGVQYAGSVSIVEMEPFKTLRQSVDDHIAHTYHWADGPCHYAIMPVEQARQIEYRSRDRALEAFEDGHPHSLCMGEL